jgi:hypothetical protein
MDEKTKEVLRKYAKPDMEGVLVLFVESLIAADRVKGATANVLRSIDRTFNRINVETLDYVYSLVKAEKIDKAMDVVFEEVDGMLGRGSFDCCDDLLPMIDVSRLDSNLMVGFLSITKAAKDKLKNRDALVKRIEQELDDPKLLDGLR